MLVSSARWRSPRGPLQRRPASKLVRRRCDALRTAAAVAHSARRLQHRQRALRQSGHGALHALPLELAAFRHLHDAPGVILLLLGQLGTDMLSTESAMRLEAGQTKNYSEDFHACGWPSSTSRCLTRMKSFPSPAPASEGKSTPATALHREGAGIGQLTSEATSGNKPPVAVVPNVTAGYGKGGSFRCP